VSISSNFLFFIVSVFHHTSCKTSRQNLEAPEILESLGSFEVSATVSEAVTSRLGLVSVSETWVSGLVSVSAQKVSCTSLFINITIVMKVESEFRLNFG